MFCIMNIQGSYSYANIRMNQIMNRINENIRKSYYHCIVVDQHHREGKYIRVHMSC